MCRNPRGRNSIGSHTQESRYDGGGSLGLMGDGSARISEAGILGRLTLILRKSGRDPWESIQNAGFSVAFPPETELMGDGLMGQRGFDQQGPPPYLGAPHLNATPGSGGAGRRGPPNR